MTDLTMVSLFAGIGGFDLAFQRAGVNVVAAVEIDQPARTVLARQFPDTALFPDVTKVTGNDLRAAGFVPDRGIITGGFPCQDLSVAGRRVGLGGERSGLFWHIIRLLAELHPRWVVLENVPGLLSSHDGADMGAVVAALGDCGYGLAYRVLDAQFFGVPQQRRRVFIVGHLGAPWSRAAEVLFEPEGGGGDSAPSRAARPGTPESVAVGADRVSQSRIDTHTHTQRLCRAAGNAGTGSTPNRQRAGTSSSVVAALTANGVGTCGADDNQAQAGHIICVTGGVTHTLTSEGADASEDGTGRGTPIVAIAPALTARYGKGTDSDASDAIIVQPLALRGRDGGAELEAREPGAPYNALRAGDGDGGSSRQSLIAIHRHAETSVRRLTPTECERLQGFPDDWTNEQSDAQRYRQLGNAVAVPVIEWIARRLVAVDEVS